MLLNKSIVVQLKIVEQQLKEAKQKLLGQVESYKQAAAIYVLQKPMDDIRLQLLREAGIKAQAHVCF
jgi:5-bromo-4-chloroindolyl phosphate hydrolysis protein